MTLISSLTRNIFLKSKTQLNNSFIRNQFSIRNITNGKPKFNSYKKQDNIEKSNTDGLLYTTSGLIFVLGLTYASVPLYRMFCAATGYNGTPVTHNDKFTPENMKPVTNFRKIRVTFNSSISDSLQWSFTPQQKHIRVVPGESALAFYTAKNLADEDIIGISSYNVIPQKVGQYFNKIQCFCFEEQKLASGEEVDMPIFFFIDPEFAEDPSMWDVDTVTLSYTFFKAKSQEL